MLWKLNTHAPVFTLAYYKPTQVVMSHPAPWIMFSSVLFFHNLKYSTLFYFTPCPCVLPACVIVYFTHISLLIIIIIIKQPPSDLLVTEQLHWRGWG